MSILPHHDRSTVTAVAGTVSRNIVAGNNACTQVFVKAANDTTTFDVTLTDIYDDVIYGREDVTGELNDEVHLTTYGNWTLTVENSSVADETFITNLIFEE